MGEFSNRLRLVIFAFYIFGAAQATDASTATNDGLLCERKETNAAERISSCTRLIEVGVDEKNLPDMYLNRGNAHYELGDYTSAISDFTEAINRRPNFVAAYQNRGQAQFRLKIERPRWRILIKLSR